MHASRLTWVYSKDKEGDKKPNNSIMWIKWRPQLITPFFGYLLVEDLEGLGDESWQIFLIKNIKNGFVDSSLTLWVMVNILYFSQVIATKFDEFFSHTIIGFGLWIVITSNLYYYFFLSPKNCRDSKPEPDTFMKGWHRFFTINDKIMSFSINLKILIGVVFVPNHPPMDKIT